MDKLLMYSCLAIQIHSGVPNMTNKNSMKINTSNNNKKNHVVVDVFHDALHIRYGTQHDGSRLKQTTTSWWVEINSTSQTLTVCLRYDQTSQDNFKLLLLVFILLLSYLYSTIAYCLSSDKMHSRMQCKSSCTVRSGK